jgi:ribosomal protein S18 acetylase RimI-like enzyme
MTWPLNPAQLAAIRSHPDTTAWTAVTSPGGTAVGHIELVERYGPGRGHIARVIVDPRLRRQGFGRKLVTAALDEAVARGLGIVTLNVRSQNEAAIRTYSGLGFHIVESAIGDPAVLRMAITLTAEAGARIDS